MDEVAPHRAHEADVADRGPVAQQERAALEDRLQPLEQPADRLLGVHPRVRVDSVAAHEQSPLAP